MGHSCREARCPSLWAVFGALTHCSQFVGAAGSLRREPNLSQIVRVCPFDISIRGQFRTLLRPPSPARKCSKCTLTPGALIRDSSIVRVLAAVSAALCGLQRAPWASYKAALLVICLQASASSTSGSSVPLIAQIGYKHNVQRYRLPHVPRANRAAGELPRPCLATPTRPAGRPARNREP